MKVTELAKVRRANRRTFQNWLHRLNDAAKGAFLAQFGKAPNSPLYVNILHLKKAEDMGPKEKQREQFERETKTRMEELELRVRRLEKTMHLGKKSQ